MTADGTTVQQMQQQQQQQQQQQPIVSQAQAPQIQGKMIYCVTPY